MDSIDPCVLLLLAEAVYPVCALGAESRRWLAEQGHLDLLKPNG